MFCGVQLFLHPGPATAIVVKKAATGVAGEVRVEGAAVGVVDGDVFFWKQDLEGGLKKHNNGDNGWNWNSLVNFPMKDTIYNLQ